MISGNELLFSFPGAQEGTGSMGRLYHMPQNMYVFIIITYSLIKSGFLIIIILNVRLILKVSNSATV